MKPIVAGKLLTAEQSVRLTVVDTLERQSLIAQIADVLRVKARANERRVRGLRGVKREAR